MDEADEDESYGNALGSCGGRRRRRMRQGRLPSASQRRDRPALDRRQQRLGLDDEASASDAKKAYRKLALKLHPDKTNGATSELFAALAQIGHQDRHHLLGEERLEVTIEETQQCRPVSLRRQRAEFRDQLTQPFALLDASRPRSLSRRADYPPVCANTCFFR